MTAKASTPPPPGSIKPDPPPAPPRKQSQGITTCTLDDTAVIPVILTTVFVRFYAFSLVIMA